MVTDHLHQLLVGMIEDSSEQRSTLDHIASLSQQCSGQAEMEHVDRLVTYVLGSSHEVSSTSVAVSTHNYSALLLTVLLCGSRSTHNILSSTAVV